ncbi:MAG: DMT family transporter [Patescibacteria group bacterium]
MENTGLFYAIGAAVVWGLVYTIDQKILSEVSPLMLLFINSIVTVVILLPFVFFTNTKTVFEVGKMGLLLILGASLLAALANFFIFSSIKSLNASTASIIEVSYPFFVVLFSFIIFRAVPNIYFFLGGALIFAGTFVIIKLA